MEKTSSNVHLSKLYEDKFYKMDAETLDHLRKSNSGCISWTVLADKDDIFDKGMVLPIGEFRHPA